VVSIEDASGPRTGSSTHPQRALLKASSASCSFFLLYSPAGVERVEVEVADGEDDAGGAEAAGSATPNLPAKGLRYDSLQSALMAECAGFSEWYLSAVAAKLAAAAAADDEDDDDEDDDDAAATLKGREKGEGQVDGGRSWRPLHRSSADEQASGVEGASGAGREGGC
jgi:hypothetical protein